MQQLPMDPSTVDKDAVGLLPSHIPCVLITEATMPLLVAFHWGDRK